MTATETLHPDESCSSEAEARFDACFRAHYAEVLAYALRRVVDRGAAEDVAAQTFAVAWHRRDRLPADPLPWLYGVARHMLRNEARSARRRARLLARIVGQPRPASAPDPADALGELSSVVAALTRPSGSQREVLYLAAWEGLDARRAADVLGCSHGAYTLRLHRARRRLAKELSASGHVDAQAEERHVAQESGNEGEDG
jgi:RNA polymerase sigma-70 factor, ECF subfamily